MADRALLDRREVGSILREIWAERRNSRPVYVIWPMPVSETSDQEPEDRPR